MVETTRHTTKSRCVRSRKPQYTIVASIEMVDNKYPRGFKFAIIMIGLCLSAFCIALDNTIIATAIPRITDDFHTLQDVGWYGSAYLLPTCAFQLFYGKLYSKLSIKGVYLVALLLFEAGSLV
jgi:predicted MFS family arabinose efflux permease